MCSPLLRSCFPYALHPPPQLLTFEEVIVVPSSSSSSSAHNLQVYETSNGGGCKSDCNGCSIDSSSNSSRSSKRYLPPPREPPPPTPNTKSVSSAYILSLSDIEYAVPLVRRQFRSPFITNNDAVIYENLRVDGVKETTDGISFKVNYLLFFLFVFHQHNIL